MLRRKKFFTLMLSAVLILVLLQSVPPITANAKSEFDLSGMAHVQSFGNQDSSKQVIDGIDTLVLGTRGMSKRVEEITVNFVNNSNYSGGLQYRVHIQRRGWTDWVDAGTPAGSRGMSYRLEGIEMRLTGDLAKHYSVRYAAHIQSYGDNQGWVYDGALAGTTGERKRLEEVKIQIIPRNNFGDTPGLSYRVHRQTYGWENVWAGSGSISGTTGQSKRLEGITIAVNNSLYEGGIKYQTHIQSIGWEDGWTYNGRMSGTNGRALRLEAIRIQLTGELSNYFNVYYRVHAQHFGWLGWAGNGADSGTAGFAYRLEAIQIVILPKSASKPDGNYGGVVSNNDKPFISKSDSSYQDNPTPPSGNDNADTDGWIPYYNNDYSLECYKVLNGYYFTRDSKLLNDGEDINNMNMGIREEVVYTVLENQDQNPKGYKLGDNKKFSYKVRNNQNSYIFDYLDGKDVENALVNGSQLSTYRYSGKDNRYKYSLRAYPNYKDSVCDVEEKLYLWAADPNYVAPYYAEYELCFPRACVDGKLTIDVYYDNTIIDTFTVESREATRYKKLYDLVKGVDTSLDTRGKLLRLREIIASNYYTNCIGGADLFSQAARHFFGLPVAYTMNKQGFKNDDENYNDSSVVNNGTFLGKVKHFGYGYVNTKMIKNIAYLAHDSSSNNCGLYYTHMSTLVYYENSWWYWDAQGYHR